MADPADASLRSEDHSLTRRSALPRSTGKRALLRLAYAAWIGGAALLLANGCGSSTLFNDGPGTGGATNVGGAGGSGGVGGVGQGGVGNSLGPGGNGGDAGGGEGGVGGEGGAGGSKLPLCGNGQINGNEDCDGANLNGNCTTFGFTDPAGLACDDGCLHDASGCKTTCDGFLEPGEPCDDGNDNPNDGCDECVVVDIVMGTCASPIAITLGLGNASVSGSTLGGGTQTTDQCTGEVGAPDRVHAVTPTADGFLTAWIGAADANYDSMIYVLNDCNDTSSGILCVDNIASGETLSFGVQANQTYFVVVDGFNGNFGDYTLNLDLSVGTCADPVPYPLWQGFPMDAAGSTVGLTNDHTSQGCGGSVSNDVVFEVMPNFTGKLEVRIDNGETNYDSVVAARTTCGVQNTQIECDHSVNDDDLIEFPVVSGTAVYVWVDGFGLSPSNGDFYMQMNPGN